MSHVREYPEIHIEVTDRAHAILAARRGDGLARHLGYSIGDRARLSISILEVVQNIVCHAGCGSVVVSAIHVKGLVCIEVIATDQGPGIADVDRALEDNFSTSNGLGRGLSGVKRLADSLEIVSSPGNGVTIRFVTRKT